MRSGTEATAKIFATTGFDVGEGGGQPNIETNMVPGFNGF